MAGYYDNLYNDACYENYRDGVNNYQNDYYLNLKAHMRPVKKCTFKGLGTTCSFYGPLNVGRTTRDSFLQGRGQILTECPECDVRRLPDTLFANRKQDGEHEYCDNTELQPLQTRVPRSCNGLMQTDITQYQFMPGAWQNGYAGYNSVVDTHIQSREDAREAYQAQCDMEYEDTSAEQRGSYGCYPGAFDDALMAYV